MSVDPSSPGKASAAVLFLVRTISVDSESLLSFLRGDPFLVRAGRWPQSLAASQDNSNRLFIRLKTNSWLQTDLERVLLLALRLAFQAKAMRCCQILLDALLRAPRPRNARWPAKKRAILALSVDAPGAAHVAFSQGFLKISNSKINSQRQHLMALSESGDIRSLAEIFSSAPLISLFKSIDHKRSAHSRLIPWCLHQALRPGMGIENDSSRSLLSHGSLLPRQEAPLRQSLSLLTSKRYGIMAIEAFLSSVQSGALSRSAPEETIVFLEALALSSRALRASRRPRPSLDKAL